MIYEPLSDEAAANMVHVLAAHALARLGDDERDMWLEKERRAAGAPTLKFVGGKVKVEA